MAVHHAVGISRQRNNYRPSKVNIMAQGLSTPDPSLSPTHLSIKRDRASTTHYTHHQGSLMMSRNTALVPSLGLRIGPACEAGLSAGMRRERVPPQRRKKERRSGVSIIGAKQVARGLPARRLLNLAQRLPWRPGHLDLFQSSG